MQFLIKCDKDILDLTYYQKEVMILVICCQRNGKIYTFPIAEHCSEPEISRVSRDR